MLWFRLLGLPVPDTQAPQTQSLSDARVDAVLRHQERVLRELDRELQLYQIETDREHHRDIRQ